MPHFECDRCGACCCGPFFIEAELLDLLREPRLAEADPDYADLSQDDVLEKLQQPGRGLCIACGPDRPCPFLDQDNGCTIYPTRPNDCVAMQAGDDQCQYARQVDGLPPLLPIDGSPDEEHSESRGR